MSSEVFTGKASQPSRHEKRYSMRLRFQDLHEADQSATSQITDGLFLVRIGRAQYRGTPRSPITSSFAVLEPKPLAASSSSVASIARSLPIAAMTAVDVTGPMPGIASSHRQASFSPAVFLITASVSSIPHFLVIKLQLSCASSTRTSPDSLFTEAHGISQGFNEIPPSTLDLSHASLRQSGSPLAIFGCANEGNVLSGSLSGGPLRSFDSFQLAHAICRTPLNRQRKAIRL